MPLKVSNGPSAAQIFGAFLSEPLRVSEHAFYGTGECFVFSLSPRGVIYPWDAAVNDTCFIHLAVADGLTIGGGGYVVLCFRFGRSVMVQ
jgi:hypothetical protein